MKRTSILLPTELRNRADHRARQLGISLGEFVRRALTEALAREGAGEVRDSLFADDAVYDGDVPSNLSEHHDDYLYGDES